MRQVIRDTATIRQMMEDIEDISPMQPEHIMAEDKKIEKDGYGACVGSTDDIKEELK